MEEQIVPAAPAPEMNRAIHGSQMTSEPAAPVAPAAPKASTKKAECTRDTRGDNPCAVENCENCN